MDMKRRDLLKGCAAAGVLLLPGIANAATAENSTSALTSEAGLRIQKSIKAGFGGGFSLRAHRQEGGLTYADIEHFGNRYSVASADLLDWKVVRSA